MKHKGFIKLYNSVLSRPELTDLLAEEGSTGFGTYLMVVIYLSQCDDGEGMFTNGQLSALAFQARKSRAYIRHIICDYGLFKIEGRRFHDAFMNQNSPARNNRYAGEDIDKDKEKENKEKAGQRVPDGTRPAGDDALGPSRYETIDREGIRHGSHGETVPWWAPPQLDVYQAWSLVADRWMPTAEIDADSEQEAYAAMHPEDFMMKTAWEKLSEQEHHRIQDNAIRV